MTATLTAAVLAVVALAAPDSGAAKRRLETTQVTLHFQGAPLDEVVESIAKATKLNFVLHPEVEVENPRVHLTIRNVSARTALRLVLGPRRLSATWRDGAVFIAPKACTPPPLVVRLYDIRPLLLRYPDFAGPHVGLDPRPPRIVRTFVL